MRTLTCVHSSRLVADLRWIPKLGHQQVYYVIEVVADVILVILCLANTKMGIDQQLGLTGAPPASRRAQEWPGPWDPC